MGRLGLGGAARTSSSSHSGQEEEDVCERVGEDAYFRKGDAIGIADGVGGWKAKQISGADAGTSDSSPSLLSFCFRRSSVKLTQTLPSTFPSSFFLTSSSAWCAQVDSRLY